MADAPPSYEPPSHEKALEFFENTLPHRVKDQYQETGYRLAADGENEDENGEKAERYSFFSPAIVFDEFGVGISLYFKTLKSLFIVLFICGLVNLVSILHNESFNPDQAFVDYFNANKNFFNFTGDIYATPQYLLGSAYGAEREDLLANKQMAADIAITVILVAFLLVSIKAQDKIVENIDKRQLSTQDYAVVVENLKHDHVTQSEPTIENLEAYFRKFGHVASITIVRKNGELLRGLANIKVLEVEKMKNLMQQGCEDDARKVESLKQAGFAIQQKIDGIQNDVVANLYNVHPIWKVFVVFNSQYSQVECIKALNAASPKHETHFNGGVPKAVEAPEPSDLIYENSDYSEIYMYLTWFISYSCAGLLLLVSFFIIQALLKLGGFQASIFISLINTALPISMKLLTSMVEIHYTNDSRQNSILQKLLIVRCLMSAVLIYIATDFEETFTYSKIEAIFSTQLLTAILNPVLQVFDMSVVFNRYILGRQAITQTDLNELYRSADWTLAERYTDVIKALFMALFYSVVYPSGLFIAAFTMLSTYIADKYSLFYQWRRPPAFGESLGVTARFFFLGSIWVHLLISMRYFAGWPFTGVVGTDLGGEPQCSFLLCETNDSMTSDQKDIVKLYSAINIILFIVVCAYLLNRTFGRVIRRYCGKEEVETEDLDGSKKVDFLDLDIPVYIPNVAREKLLDLVICVPLGHVPESLLPESFTSDDNNSHNESVVEVSSFPGKSVADLEQHFGCVRVYAKEEGMKGVNPAPGALIRQFSKKKMSAKHKSVKVESGASSNSAPKSLPPGWERKFTPTGREYFVDHNTKTTKWTLPESIENASQIAVSQKNTHPVFAAKSSPLGVQMSQNYVPPIQAVLNSSQGLPEGWEERTADDGRIFYVNHNDQSTHWTRPN